MSLKYVHGINRIELHGKSEFEIEEGKKWIVTALCEPRDRYLIPWNNNLIHVVFCGKLFVRIVLLIFSFRDRKRKHIAVDWFWFDSIRFTVMTSDSNNHIAHSLRIWIRETWKTSNKTKPNQNNNKTLGRCSSTRPWDWYFFEIVLIAKCDRRKR